MEENLQKFFFFALPPPPSRGTPQKENALVGEILPLSLLRPSSSVLLFSLCPDVCRADAIIFHILIVIHIRLPDAVIFRILIIIRIRLPDAVIFNILIVIHIRLHIRTRTPITVFLNHRRHYHLLPDNRGLPRFSTDTCPPSVDRGQPRPENTGTASRA